MTIVTIEPGANLSEQLSKMLNDAIRKGVGAALVEVENVTGKPFDQITIEHINVQIIAAQQPISPDIIQQLSHKPDE